MEHLMRDLGIAFRASRDSRVAQGMLTLREMDELLRRGGLTAGLVPESERRVAVPGHQQDKRIDWVWRLSRDDDRVVAAFEIDGLSVDGPNVEKALLTLPTLNPPLKFLLLFQVDHDFSWKGNKGRVRSGRSTEVDARKARIKAANIVVRRDVDLTNPSASVTSRIAFHEVIARAQAEAKKLLTLHAP